MRILEGSHGTGAITRVLVETVDTRGGDWMTVGVHENVVEASWQALVDSLTYGLTLRPGLSRLTDALPPSRSGTTTARRPLQGSQQGVCTGSV